MEQETKNTSLDDLRSETVNLNNEIVFEKSLFGGYNKKAVSEYIKLLKDDLQNADVIFKERLEEYAAMSSMLTQERDKYIEMLNTKENLNSELKEHIEQLKKENEALSEKMNELSEDVLDHDEIALYADTLEQNNKMKIELEEMENKLSRYESVEGENGILKTNIDQLELTVQELSKKIEVYIEREISNKEYENENTMLKTNINQLELTIQDLNKQIEVYIENEVLKEEFDMVTNENQLIKQQYDEAMAEKSVVFAERNILIEQNKRIAESLTQAEQKVKESREENTKIKLKTRKMMSEFETKIYECSHNHQKNIEQITDNINNALHILSYETMDIKKLISGNDEKIFPEDDVVDL